ncbi:mitochondrial presequence protease [Diplodia corticola]|uniref:Mitochondrial presequence protease n=1 Tax=Diplodia corticola TaxID=236234 RepID=A0A1J9R822_9PEZI|nr:mitochondrial presequence protease [Diplodia corticola]OJD36346.1 mitochondrial presequence protease [Diplodia corticola]
MLPTLSDVPTHHPDCCLSLSNSLFSTLSQILSPSKGPVLSIGAGSGLLEAILGSRDPIRTVEGVEVNSSVNKYLPEESSFVVGGTWDLCPRARDASVWVFVYPRVPALVERYFETFGQARLELAVFLGPKADWADFQCAFRVPGFTNAEIVEDCGLVPYEVMAVIRKEQADK